MKSNLKALLSGRINGRHGFAIDYARTETIYTCDECKVKFDPKDVRWVGQQSGAVMNRRAVILVGHTLVSVTVLDETEKSYLCELTADATLPGRNNHQKKGHKFYAPKDFVQFVPDKPPGSRRR